MKYFFIGLLLGIVFSVAAFYFMAVPGIKQTEFDSGYAKGIKEGTDKGITTGIAQGVEQVHAELQRVEDSTVAALQQLEAQRKAAQKRQAKKQKPVQNWHVINGKIGDPIVDE